MIKDNQKGVSLIITFFIMIIILSVVLSISIILYSEVKVIRNISNSMVGLYAADSGIEKVLYYDRQETSFSSGQSCTNNSTCVDPKYPICSGGYCTVSVSRGLCSMFASINPNSCPTSGAQTDSSIYCAHISADIPSNVYFPTLSAPSTSVEGYAYPNNGCDPNTCNDCEISFNTTLDSGITYYTTAKVYPNDTNSDFEVDSRGVFSGVGREIQILVTTCAGNFDPSTSCTTCLKGYTGSDCNTPSP